MPFISPLQSPFVRNLPTAPMHKGGSFLLPSVIRNGVAPTFPFCGQKKSNETLLLQSLSQPLG